MKKIIFVALVLIAIYATSFAQGKTPSTVLKAFSQKFPDAKSVKWDKENPNNYEASFEWNSMHYSANFSDKGEWLETESHFTFAELPEKVKYAFNTAHKGTTPKAVSKIETLKQGTIYELEIPKGLKIVEVFYKPDGTETKE